MTLRRGVSRHLGNQGGEGVACVTWCERTLTGVYKLAIVVHNDYSFLTPYADGGLR